MNVRRIMRAQFEKFTQMLCMNQRVKSFSHKAKESNE